LDLNNERSEKNMKTKNNGKNENKRCKGCNAIIDSSETYCSCCKKKREQQAK